MGCDRKARDIYSWETLLHLQGDYFLYINYEYDGEYPVGELDPVQKAIHLAHECTVPVSIDTWTWRTQAGYDWRKKPRFDQDQARLASIVTARNMCIEFALQTDASHLLFVDADIIPPVDIIPRLLEVKVDAVGGLVFGRGVHAGSRYVFQEKQRYRLPSIYTSDGWAEIIECEHGNIGFTMISRKLFESVRFRYGMAHYPDRDSNWASDDPCFHADVHQKFGTWMAIRTDVEGKHCGELDHGGASQY
jgi:hypothetical protein